MGYCYRAVSVKLRFNEFLYPQGTCGYRLAVCTQFLMQLKLWGQAINQESVSPEVWSTHIKRGLWREGEPVKIGINQKIVDTLWRKSKDSRLVISCSDPDVKLEIAVAELCRSEEFIDTTAPSGSMPMRLVTIPTSAYKKRI